MVVLVPQDNKVEFYGLAVVGESLCRFSPGYCIIRSHGLVCSYGQTRQGAN